MNMNLKMSWYVYVSVKIVRDMDMHKLYHQIGELGHICAKICKNPLVGGINISACK